MIENKTTTQQVSEEVPDNHTIFTGQEFTTADYDKKIRNARTAIFVVGGAQLLLGSILAFTGPEEDRMLSLGICVFLAAVFIGLGFWTKKKPYAAIVTALCLYVGLIILAGIDEPETLVRGIILKVVIIVYLAKGLCNAKEAERMRSSLEAANH